jgi:serine/threonine protein kinase/tetratricopeptide (TPR) repeat protein
VASATVVLVIIGPRWLEILHERKNAAVDHVRVEVRLALESARSVVPVLVGRAAMPAEADLADFADLQPLLQRNGRLVRPDPDFDGDLEPIIAHIKQFDSDEAIGATLADKYTLTAEVGHGGMGVVYRAEQKQPVKRTVAVKLIKPGMDSRDVLARFDAERQALAVMDHPHIAKVHDAGLTAQGRPFFVMEYVKGVPITQYCDEKKLTPQERLNRFIPVCNAVQHAHQKGIIHRDLKPSNVLVEVIDGRPVAKVIDFGLAKALGHKLTDMTQPPTALDMRVGTLEYSAPEQAAGRSFDVDTRSDIYSLGVLLYELLTGAPPFTHEELMKIGEEEMRRVIREDEPAKPSKKLSSSGALPSIAANRQLEPKKLTRLVRGDLDWIVMKCLEKEQARRYETANQLGQELQRFLADEPVQAGPPSAVYRLRKFVRRNKAGLLTTAAVLLAVLLAAGGIGWALWEHAAQETARRLELAGRMAETEKAVTVALTKAEQSEERAKRLPCTTSMEAKASLAEWRDAAASLAEAEAALRTGAAADDLRERVADMRERIASGQTLAQRREKLFRDLDDARMALATQRESNFDFAGAAAKYAAAFAAFGIEVQPGQTEVLAQQIRSEAPAVRDALIVALDNWAFCVKEPMKTDLLAIAQAADEDAWRRDYRRAEGQRDTRALVRLSKETRRLTQPPVSLLLLATALFQNDQRDEALVLLRWAHGLHPTDFWIALELGNYLGESKAATPVDLEERIGCYRVAVALRPDADIAHNNLGIALYDNKQPDEAIAEFNKAIELEPKDVEAHYNLGTALKGKNQLDEAIAEYNKAIELDPNDVGAHFNLGGTLLRQSRFAQAEASFQRCLELLSAGDPWREGTAMRLKQARRLLELDKKLPSILSGETKPTDSAEFLDLIELCQIKQLNAAAARFSKLALADKPALADELDKGYRYDAACFAALAAAGQGKDAGKLTDQERADLRKQALQWLRADLAAWSKQFDEAADKARPVVQDRMNHWKQDTDLTGVRDPKALEKLSPDERDAWQRLWKDVDALLAKTREKK